MEKINVKIISTKIILLKKQNVWHKFDTIAEQANDIVMRERRNEGAGR